MHVSCVYLSCYCLFVYLLDPLNVNSVCGSTSSEVATHVLKLLHDGRISLSCYTGSPLTVA